MFAFDIRATAMEARCGQVTTDHGSFDTPAFMPVGTAGAVKALTTEQLEQLNTGIILSNTYHLALRPGMDRLKALGGLHQLMGWQRPILTDSGGFQVLSLASRRKIDDEGVTFRSHLDGSELRFTPESVVDHQRVIGSDIMMPLDVCPGFDDDPGDITRATELTHRWAEKAYSAWQAMPESYQGHSQTLFGIVQGGYTESGRRESAKFISSLGFPGWAIGGLVTAEPLSTTWQLVAAATAELPASGPRYLMGVGTPSDIVRAVALGIDMFDCVLPTRNARNGSVFTNKGTLNLRSARFADDQGPIDPECDCPVCTRHSRAYVRHLLRCNEITGLVLTTIHSVYFYISLMSRIRSRIQDGSFASWAKDFLATYEQLAGEEPAEREVTA